MRESDHIGLRIAGTAVFTALTVFAIWRMEFHAVPGYRWPLGMLVAMNICGVIGIWKGVKHG